MIIKASPVLLGPGVPLVARLGRAVALDLAASTTHAGGVVVLDEASFAVDEAATLARRSAMRRRAAR